MIIHTTVNNFIILLINLLTSILAARLLGTDGRGQLALVLLYPQMIATMGLLGLDRGIAIIGGQKRLNYPVASTTGLAMMLSMPVMLISYFIITDNILNPSLEKLSLIYIFYVPALYLFMFSGSLFNGLGMFFEYNLSRLYFYGSYLVLIIVFWLADMPYLDSFVYASLLSVYTAMLVSMVLHLKVWRRRAFEGVRWLWMPGNFFKDVALIFRKAFVFVVPGVLLVVATKLDQIIVSGYLELKYLGFFVVYMAYSLLLGPIVNAVSVNIFHLGVINSKNNIAKIVRLTIFIYICGSILLVLLAPFLIELLYGELYLEHIDTARLLVLSSFLFFCSKTINEFMMGKSMVRQDVIASVIFMVFLLFFTNLLIPELSLFGVAISMVIANAIRSFYLGIVFHQSSGIRLPELLFVRVKDLKWIILLLRRVIKV